MTLEFAQSLVLIFGVIPLAWSGVVVVLACAHALYNT